MPSAPGMPGSMELGAAEPYLGLTPNVDLDSSMALIPTRLVSYLVDDRLLLNIVAINQSTDQRVP